MTIAPEELYALGNTALLQLPKTAFFCSRQYPPSVERGTYLWALEQRSTGRCVVSGFHSQLEQAVFRYLLHGACHPIVYALGRGIQPAVRLEYEPEIEEGRLLFVSPFEAGVLTVSQDTADIRNLLIMDMAEQLFIPYLAEDGNLDRLLREYPPEKPIYTLDLPENEAFLNRGALPYSPIALLGGTPAA